MSYVAVNLPDNEFGVDRECQMVLPEINNDKYSSFVRTMRVALPTVALFILVILFVRLAMDDTTSQFSPSSEGRKSGEIQMMGATYEGVDKANRPYRVTATQASRSVINPNMMDLTQPMADMTLEDGTWLSVRSEKGTYKQEGSILLLTGNVEIYHDSGYELKTDRMEIDFSKGQASSDSDVGGRGPSGTLKAKGFRVIGTGNQIIFIGPAQMTFTAVGKDLR